MANAQVKVARDQQGARKIVRSGAAGYSRNQRRDGWVETNRRIAARLVARFRYRVGAEDSIVNPARGFNDELARSLEPGTQEFMPASRMGGMSNEDFDKERAAVVRVSEIWTTSIAPDGEFSAADLLGHVAYDTRDVESYALCERYTFGGQLTYEQASREAPMDEMFDIQRIMGRFDLFSLAGERLYSPLYMQALCEQEGLASDYVQSIDTTVAMQLTRELWHYSTSLSKQAILGELLLRPDFGRSLLDDLEELLPLFDITC